MKAIQLLSLVLFSTVKGLAQQAEPLIFTEKIHDFGNIREEDGNADFEFVFTNNSGRTIKILSVQASCGCTTPGWTKDPVSQGETAFIKASYNPKGRPGYFNKTLTVTTDLDAAPIVLQIKGQVLTDDEEDNSGRLNASSGNLRLKNSSFNLGRVYNNKANPAVEYMVFNAGVKAIQFISIVKPEYINVETPKALQPKESGTIKITFDGQKKNAFGFVSENIELLTDDEDLARKSFSVYATLEEYFAPLSESDLKKVPVLKLESDVLDFKDVKSGATVSREIKIKNEGKRELIIRSLQSNCICMTASAKETKIKAGGEGTISVTLNTNGRRGTQNKAVTIYSTDPVNPVQKIAVAAVVN